MRPALAEQVPDRLRSGTRGRDGSVAKAPLHRRLARLLRKPEVIVTELTVIAVASLLGATIPQVPVAGAWVESPAGDAGWVIQAVGFDRVFSTGWFLALVLLAAASLSVVLTDLWRRAWRMWRRAPSEAWISNASFRHEEVVHLSEQLAARRVWFRDKHRIGLWGSPLFHLGLLLFVAAGLIRMLFGVDAVVDLVEGETLSPTAAAYGAQWPGRLARPFALEDPLTLQLLYIDQYRQGELRQLSAKVLLGAREHRLAINESLSGRWGTLYLTSTYGPAVLLTSDLGGGTREGHMLLLYESEDGRLAGELELPDDTRVRVTARSRLDPKAVDVRILRGGALLATERLQPGDGIRMLDGSTLQIVGVARWARFMAKRDASMPMVYAGFLLAVAGVLLLYGIVRVQEAIVWEPAPEGARLVVAMRPQRFAPLFAPSFEQRVVESRMELLASQGAHHA